MSEEVKVGESVAAARAADRMSDGNMIAGKKTVEHVASIGVKPVLRAGEGVPAKVVGKEVIVPPTLREGEGVAVKLKPSDPLGPKPTATGNPKAHFVKNNNGKISAWCGGSGTLVRVWPQVSCPDCMKKRATAP